MLSICTQFYDDDYDKITTFLESVHTSMKCDYEILMFDNRLNKELDVLTDYIKCSSCKEHVHYISNPYPLDILTVRKHLLSLSNGEYVWFVNIRDRLTGIITDDMAFTNNSDVIVYSGYIDSENVKTNVKYFAHDDLIRKDPLQKYELLSDLVFSTWTFWVKRSFIDSVFKDYVNFGLNIVEDVFIRSFIISHANSITGSPEVFYITTEKKSKLLYKSDFDNFISEIENIRAIFSEDLLILKSFSDDRMFLKYLKKFIEYFDGTDQELIETLEGLIKLFNINYNKLNELIQGIRINNLENFDRLHYLCNVSYGYKTSEETPTFDVSWKTDNFHSINGLDGHTFNSGSLAICIRCSNDNYFELDNIIDTIQSNIAFDGSEMWVMDCCTTVNITKRENLNYIDCRNLSLIDSRVKCLKAINTEYLWFINADSKIQINFNVKDFLKNDGTDVISFMKVFFDRKSFYSHVDLCQYVLDNTENLEIIDFIFSKKMYKSITNLPEINTDVGADEFIITSILMKCNGFSHYNDILIHSSMDKTFEPDINRIDEVDRLINLSKILFTNVIHTMYVDKVMYYVSNKFPLLNNGFDVTKLPYLSNSVDRDFDEINLKTVDKSVDIIYVFYGTNLDNEIDKLKSKIKCSSNIIIIDLLGNYNGELRVIHEESFYKSLIKALEFLETNNVWLLESYKHTYNFNGALLKDVSVYYHSDKASCFTPLSRNNIILTKGDFIEFTNSYVNLSFEDLVVSLYEFLMGVDHITIHSDLVSVEPFDENSINVCVLKDSSANVTINTLNDLKGVFTNVNFTNGFDNKTLYVGNKTLITDKEKLLRLMSEFPSMCQYKRYKNVDIIEGLFWSIDRKIAENFYNNITGTDALDLLKNYKSNLFGNVLKLERIHLTDALDEPVQFNFCDVIFNRDLPEKDELNVGLIEHIKALPENLAVFIEQYELDVVYVLSDWKYIEPVLDIYECSVAPIPKYKTVDDTIGLIREHLNSLGKSFSDITVF